MKNLLRSLCLLLLLTTYAKAQNLHQLKGRTIDTASTTLLNGATIAVLNAKDSTLVKFTRSNENGNFEINGIKNGKFILLVSYPKYADFVDEFTLDSTQQIKDFGKINLVGTATLLQDVLVKGNRNAIKIKGDTTEFDPKAYNIEPNAKVEDLIKQFPGIQVDKDGKITAQGKTVQKVLVDGEEFFGDDPTLVTKNLRADMVDKVQLYDKTSDQAAFTGIDDGQKAKTLNIKLKEDKKNGYFGKLEGGYGTKDFYNSQALFNRFWGKKKFSAYGILSNTGTVGLNWDDSRKYGSDNNVQVGDDGGIYYSYSSSGDDFEDFNGQYGGRGLPTARTGGLHFDDKWNKDNESLNTNYKIGYIRLKTVSEDLSQNNLPNGIINNQSNQNDDKDVLRQKIDATYQIKLDTTATLKLSINGANNQGSVLSSFNSSSTDGNNNPLNKSERKLSNNTDEQNFFISAFLTKKLKKNRRTFSLNLSQSINQNKANGKLFAENTFFETTGVRDSITNQLKINNIKNNAFTSNATYTEPLGKSLSVIVNYGLNLTDGRADRRSFNLDGNANYTVLDNRFSSDFKLNQVSNQGGLVFNIKKTKTTVNFGSKISAVNFKQIDLLGGNSVNRNFINYFPQATYQYRFSQQKSLRLSYNGNTSQPTIDQLQPLTNNNNPLNIVVGNPTLKPSFRSNFNGSFNDYKVIKDQSLYFNVYYSFTNNPIVSDVTTDTQTGKTTSRFVNITKAQTDYFLYASFSRKLLDVNVGLNLRASGNKGYNFINTNLNETLNNSFSGALRVYKYVDGKYNFYLNGGPSYNVSKASIGNLANNNGWVFNGGAGGRVYLPAKFEISTDADYNFRGKTPAFNQTFSQFIWNAYLSKKFLKSQGLKLTLSANDILNQNTGFTRSAFNGNITQNTVNTIRRFFMFSIVWDFSKMGGSTPIQKK